MCGITVNGLDAIWSYSLGAPGQTEIGDTSFLKINDITIQSNANRSCTVIQSGFGTVEIDNSTIRNRTASDAYAVYVLNYNNSQVSVRNSLLESLSQTQLDDLGPTFDTSSLTENSWIIAETASIEDGSHATNARLRLHNVSLSAHGVSSKTSNFIITNAPSNNKNHILMEGVYMYSNSESAFTYSLLNISNNDAIFYAAGTIISCGTIPTANYGVTWMGYPATVTSSSLVQWNLQSVYSPRPY